MQRLSSSGRAALILLALLAGCRDATEPPLAPTADPPLAVAPAVATLSFRQLTAGVDHACGLTTDNRAYCWGNNYSGQLGDGTSDRRLRPVAVATGLTFRQLSAGGAHTCGVTTDNKAYCWGNNGTGQLGDGTRTTRPTPTPVAGGRLFRQVTAGGDHTCGLAATDGRAYCWGWNENGQLGDFSRTTRLSPVPVGGGRQFRQVSGGLAHSCAVTPGGDAWCWGMAQHGQIGDGADVFRRTAPKLVAGGYDFVQVEAGYYSTCGVTSDDRAYCWGHGGAGQLGTGSTASRNTPGLVAGGLRFDRVAVGESHACGETTTNRAYCWGDNSGGRLGDGTGTITRLKPVPVAGGLTFAQVTVGVHMSCGTTTDNEGYCWGFNTIGELGDGTTTPRSVPTAIASPL